MSRTPSPPPESELPAGRVLPRIFTTRRVVPEPGSLFDILHRYARDSLYLAPICWTERHNELLVNRFTQLPLLETPVAPPSLYPSPPSPTHLLAPAIQSDTQDARLSKHLRTLMTPTDYHGQPYSYVNYSQDLRSKTMGLFLQEVFSGGDYWSNIKVPIRAGRHYHSGKFLCQGIWTPPGLPVLAYVDRDYTQWTKSSCFRVYRPGNGSNEPVRRLHQLRSKRLVPKNRDEDPFLVGAMLGLAQIAAYSGSELDRRQFSPADVSIHLITPCPEAEAFIIHTGHVSTAFLEMFHDNHKAPSADFKIDIDYQYVPAWSEHLRERLAQAMGLKTVQDLTNHIPPNPVPTVPSNAPRKRKRDPFSPIDVNGDGGKKRAILPSSPAAKRAKQGCGSS